MNDLIRPPLYGAIHPIEPVGVPRGTDDRRGRRRTDLRDERLLRARHRACRSRRRATCSRSATPAPTGSRCRRTTTSARGAAEVLVENGGVRVDPPPRDVRGSRAARESEAGRLTDRSGVSGRRSPLRSARRARGAYSPPHAGRRRAPRRSRPRPRRRPESVHARPRSCSSRSTRRAPTRSAPRPTGSRRRRSTRSRREAGASARPTRPFPRRSPRTPR